MQKIIPNLWFNTDAEEAVRLYTSVFNNGKVHETTHYTEAGFEIHGMPAGTVLTQEFEIEGFRMLALNGGPVFKFTPAISFMVYCTTTEEVDPIWNKLVEGGKAMMELASYPFSPRYGWLADKYGVTWQIMCSDRVKKREIRPSMLFVKEKFGQAADAIDFYTSIFPSSKVGERSPYPPEMAQGKKALMYAEFVLAGQNFVAMDGPGTHEFSFNEAISLIVSCKDQQEIDMYWNKLSAVPESEQCGWLKDKFGVSWQITPEGMGAMLNSDDKEAADRAMNAMLQMKKIDMARLQAAYKGK